jgi:hypothetical protein
VIGGIRVDSLPHIDWCLAICIDNVLRTLGAADFFEGCLSSAQPSLGRSPDDALL